MDSVHHYHSPLGDITLASDGQALIGLWFDGQTHFAENLTEDCVEQPLPIFDEADRWLDIYFSGREPDFSPLLHMRTTAFRKAVWTALLAIPYGQTVSYSQVAAKAAAILDVEFVPARAVGGAVGHNAISLIIPCHRVVGADGSLTGYAGGLERKLHLLEMERTGSALPVISQCPIPIQKGNPGKSYDASAESVDSNELDAASAVIDNLHEPGTVPENAPEAENGYALLPPASPELPPDSQYLPPIQDETARKAAHRKAFIRKTAVRILAIAVVLVLVWQFVLPLFIHSVSGCKAAGDYQSAYRLAKGPERDSVIAETHVINTCQQAIGRFRYPDSFALSDAVYDLNNYILLAVSGRNSFGSTVTNIWYYEYRYDGYYLIETYTDLEEEPIYAWDTALSQYRKSMSNTQKRLIATYLESGTWLTDAQVRNLNHLFSSGRLMQIEMIPYEEALMV